MDNDASMSSKVLSGSELSDQEESPVFPPDLPDAQSEDSHPTPALSSWQDIVSAIKLRFEEEMLPPFPRKRTCRVRDDSSFHQEEEGPVFRLPFFPTLLGSFGFLQEDLRNPPKPGSTDSAPLPQSSFPRRNPWTGRTSQPFLPWETARLCIQPDQTPVCLTCFLPGNPVSPRSPSPSPRTNS